MTQLENYLSRWQLHLDGLSIETATSNLQPVLTRDGEKAMLKVAKAYGDDELTALMLAHFNGHGAVKLLAEEGHASLMERAIGTASLKDMALNGQDMEAARIICATVRRLHSSPALPKGAPELADVLNPLLTASGENYSACAASARELLSDTARVALHGDIHHENILDDARGWLAIDPKGRIGPPQYDYANLFLNPVYANELVHNPTRIQDLAKCISEETGLTERKILVAAHAHAGQAAIWCGEDSKGVEFALTCAGLLSDRLA